MHDHAAIKYNFPSQMSFSLYRAGHCFMQQPVPAPVPESSPSVARVQPSGFKLPMKRNQQPQPTKVKAKCLHNPDAENALILNAGQAGAVPVVVDPYICR